MPRGWVCLGVGMSRGGYVLGGGYVQEWLGMFGGGYV